MGVKFTETDKEMSVRVGPPVFYGRFLEFGVNEKTVEVKNRRVRSRDVRSKTLGLRKMKDGSMRGVIRRGAVQRGTAAAFKKRVRVPPHPFMGPALETMRDRALSRLGAACVDAVEGV
jgi:hypothetical protein